MNYLVLCGIQQKHFQYLTHNFIGKLKRSIEVISVILIFNLNIQKTFEILWAVKYFGKQLVTLRKMFFKNK